jgi:hypothetical protein
MSPVLAIAAVAVLFLVLLAPLALAAWKRTNPAPVLAVYAVLLAGLVTYQSGTFAQAEVPDLAIADGAPTAIADPQCAEILELLDGAGAIIDRSNPPRLVVAQEGWSQLPEVVQGAVLECVERSWPSGAGEAQVEAR